MFLKLVLNEWSDLSESRGECVDVTDDKSDSRDEEIFVWSKYEITYTVLLLSFMRNNLPLQMHALLDLTC